MSFLAKCGFSEEQRAELRASQDAALLGQRKPANVLGIIPAKGISVGIPRKNMVDLCGRPLLWWTLDTAVRSSLASVIVSTQDEYIAGYVCGLGTRAAVMMEPAHFAASGGDTLGVAQWNVNQLDVKPDAVMVLQPTCPLRRVEDIDGAIELMWRTGCDSVVSYVSVGASHPARMARIAGDRRVLPVDTNATFKRRQDLDEMYIRSGDIYLTKTDVLLGGSMVGKEQRAWTIPAERHCNIDTPDDLILAAAKMEYLTCS